MQRNIFFFVRARCARITYELIRQLWRQNDNTITISVVAPGGAQTSTEAALGKLTCDEYDKRKLSSDLKTTPLEQFSLFDYFRAK